LVDLFVEVGPLLQQRAKRAFASFEQVDRVGFVRLPFDQAVIEFDSTHPVPRLRRTRRTRGGTGRRRVVGGRRLRRARIALGVLGLRFLRLAVLLGGRRRRG